MSTVKIDNIWIDAEHWAEGEWRPDDEIVDVLVTLIDGSRWEATTCSFKHVQTLTSRWSRSGECLGGRYFWAKNLILVTDTSRTTIEQTILDLIENGEFECAMAKINLEPNELKNDSGSLLDS
ncbi:hypothetical protein [Duganella sp. CF458]|uniref:hypothetical protein n=1 Tax=Duganella sp. CF458 TaxID=1884368 RepID=UPI000B811347|nr:hypothetical protein [Duganella sp. CF458]